MKLKTNVKSGSSYAVGKIVTTATTAAKKGFISSSLGG